MTNHTTENTINWDADGFACIAFQSDHLKALSLSHVEFVKDRHAYRYRVASYCTSLHIYFFHDTLYHYHVQNKDAIFPSLTNHLNVTPNTIPNMIHNVRLANHLAGSALIRQWGTLIRQWRYYQGPVSKVPGWITDNTCGTYSETLPGLTGCCGDI